jgi:hypothetical protein
MKVFWDTLITRIEVCLSDIKNVNLEELINSLDCLFDEIRSNEIIEKKEDTLRFLKICQTILDKFENLWYLIAMTSFTLQHYYKNLIDFKNEIIDGEDIHIFASLLKFSTEHSKREVRDATSQSIGTLLSIFGNEIIEKFKEKIIKKEFKKYEEAEGYMMLIGYITSNCHDITESNFEMLLNELIKYSSDEQFKTYSSYTRVQSMKGMNRVFKERDFLKGLYKYENIQKLVNSIESIILERISDVDINVRRVKYK